MADVAKFRTVYDRFVKYVRDVLTDPLQRKEIDKISFKVDAAFSINARGAIRLFVKSITPHAERILGNDVQYYLENDVHISEEDKKEFGQLQEKLRAWWPNFSEEQQQFVVKHMKLLVMLSCKAVQDEPLRQIINKFRDASNPLTFD